MLWRVETHVQTEISCWHGLELPNKLQATVGLAPRSPPPATPLLKTWKIRLGAFAVSLGPLYWIAGVIRPESTFVVQCSFHDALFTWKTRTMHLLCLFIHTKLSIAGEWERGSGWGLGVGWNQRAIINPFSHTNHWNTTYNKYHHPRNAMITQHCFIFGRREEGVALINRWRSSIYNIRLLVIELSAPF